MENQSLEVKQGKHTEYRQRRLPMWRRIAGVSEEAPWLETLKALVEKKQYAEATELLFCSERGGQLVKDRIGFGLYLQLWTGQLSPQFIVEIAEHHHWSDKAEKGLSIEVYPGEFLVIEEPTATNVLQAWNQL